MPDTITPAVVAALAKGGAELIAKALNSFAEKIGVNIKTILEEKNSDLAAHFRSSYERCTKIKTLLNRAEPIDLLTIYVNTKFEVGRSSKIDDYSLIEQIGKLNKIAITGTGGGGKTIFMKYLWLSLFTVKIDKIPVFIELRRLNELTSDDVMTYVYKSIIGTSAVISEKAFLEAAKRGTIVFIFDGFDEIAKEKKEIVERQLLKFGNENPDSIIIVSGRPDQRFESWQGFSVFQVSPMSKTQVLDLISKVDYEKTTKTNFARRVKADLYAKHPTFMSNPLLATMMMLTFDQFADIPEKIYVFYEQAFDTLFSKHDATKEGFKRQHRAGLPIDTFKHCFSYVCLFSYYKEKFEFTYTELLGFVQKSLKVTSIQANAEDFITDLKEAICLIQEEGLLHIFTHRSFQEYFTAFCLANFISEKLSEILDQIYQRHNDNVIRMLFEMNQSKVEREFLLPKLKSYVNDAQKLCLAEDINNTGTYLALEAMIHRDQDPKGREKSKFKLEYVSGNDRFMLFLLLRRLYWNSLWCSSAELKNMEERDATSINRISRRYPETSPKDFVAFKVIFAPDSNSVIVPPGHEYKILPLTEIQESGFGSYWIGVWSKIKVLTDAITLRLETAQRDIEDILEI